MAAPILTLPPKLPGETLVYGVDFAGDLGGATIVSAGVTATGGSVVALPVNGSVVAGRVSGGAPDGSIVLLFEAHTSDGQTLQCAGLIPVKRVPAGGG